MTEQQHLRDDYFDIIEKDTTHMTDILKYKNINPHDQMIYAEQVRLTYKPFKLSITGTLAGAILFVAIQWNVVSHAVLLVWLLLMSVHLVMHFFLSCRYFSTAPTVEGAKRWGHYYIFSTALSGIMLGTGSILFFPEGNFEQQITVLFAMAIISAAGVITISFIRGAAYAFIIPAMLPLIPLFMMEGTYLSTIFAIITLAILIFLLLSVNYIYSTSYENIGLRLTAVENEKSLLLAKEEVDKASHAKSAFISNMSHELRTPMNVILGYSQILESSDSIHESDKSSAQEILKAGYHLLDLINEVLDLAKIESGHIKLNLEQIELTELIDECLSLVSSLAAKQDITIHRGNIVKTFVYSDSIRLKQVLINLLSNAIKYNHEQGEVGIEVTPANEGAIRITVYDTGIGIDNDRVDELFQPFNRLNAENTDIEGTGIGLTITCNLVEMMGGSIGVDSEKNVGSRFWIELPKEAFE